MELQTILKDIADYLQEYDSAKPVHKAFQPGIGPFGEPQLIKAIAVGLASKGYTCFVKQKPDLEIGPNDWAVEFKLARPYGDNGREAENWSVNLLHPYAGNTSSIGDALKLKTLSNYHHKAVCVIGYEHDPARISLDPLVSAFEKIAVEVVGILLGPRFEETRRGLVHPEHQIVRCFAWEVI
jgi:hypothetical protein